jgi:hypothetical protein
VDPAIASQAPFDAMGSFVTQDDFPAIVAAIREQNRANSALLPTGQIDGRPGSLSGAIDVDRRLL